MEFQQGATTGPISRKEESEDSSLSYNLKPIHTLEVAREDGKLILPEEYCKGKLGFDFSKLKKWAVLSVIFAVQVSMNFNASIYGNAVKGMQEEFNVSGFQARTGQAIFLITYGIGSELWAPWSEDIGRWPIMQASLFLVNIFQLLPALAPNFPTVIIGRALGGLSSAGGSVTLGMIADMWTADNHQFALNFMVLSSCGGSALGPIFGAVIQRYLSWRWVFWISMILGAVVQLIHFLFVPETRIESLITVEAKRLRKEKPEKHSHIYSPDEVAESLLKDKKKILQTWARPFVMFATEPIVLWLSLLSGFSDSLIFSFIDSFHPVYQQWGFNTIEHGFTFIPIVIAYLVAYLTYLPMLRKHQQIRDRDPHRLQPESRLLWLTYTAPFLALGLFTFAAATFGPPHQLHWIVSMVFVFLVAIANYNIYMCTVDYMVAAYGPYSASATGGNALARDVLAGCAAWYSAPFYDLKYFPAQYRLFWPTFILAVLASFLTISVYVIYFNGPKIRANSKMAEDIGHHRHEVDTRRNTLNPTDVMDIEQTLRNRFSRPGTRQPSLAEMESKEAIQGSEKHEPKQNSGNEQKRSGDPEKLEVSELPGPTTHFSRP